MFVTTAVCVSCLTGRTRIAYFACTLAELSLKDQFVAGRHILFVRVLTESPRPFNHRSFE